MLPFNIGTNSAKPYHRKKRTKQIVAKDHAMLHSPCSKNAFFGRPAGNPNQLKPYRMLVVTCRMVQF
jgi:hypothetical protein